MIQVDQGQTDQRPGQYQCGDTSWRRTELPGNQHRQQRSENFYCGITPMNGGPTLAAAATQQQVTEHRDVLPQSYFLGAGWAMRIRFEEVKDLMVGNR